jgi:hypothetical protein
LPDLPDSSAGDPGSARANDITGIFAAEQKKVRAERQKKNARVG